MSENDSTLFNVDKNYNVFRSFTWIWQKLKSKLRNISITKFNDQFMNLLQRKKSKFRNCI